MQNVLRPDELVPDPEHSKHAALVLQRTFQRLREETGDRRVTRQPPARRAPAGRAARPAPEFQLSPKQTRVKAAARRLEFDLVRFLRREADRDGGFEPEHLEFPFGLGRPASRWRSRPA